MFNVLNILSYSFVDVVFMFCFFYGGGGVFFTSSFFNKSLLTKPLKCLINASLISQTCFYVGFSKWLADIR